MTLEKLFDQEYMLTKSIFSNRWYVKMMSPIIIEGLLEGKSNLDIKGVGRSWENVVFMSLELKQLREQIKRTQGYNIEVHRHSLYERIRRLEQEGDVQSCLYCVHNTNRQIDALNEVVNADGNDAEEYVSKLVENYEGVDKKELKRKLLEEWDGILGEGDIGDVPDSFCMYGRGDFPSGVLCPSYEKYNNKRLERSGKDEKSKDIEKKINIVKYLLAELENN